MTRGLDMEIVGVEADEVVASGPQDITGRIDDRRLTRVVRTDKNVQSAPQFQHQRDCQRRNTESRSQIFQR